MTDSTASPREAFEQAQNAWLSPCAVRESQSGGRKFTESEHPYRTCFERDRDRVMHCAAFRRLDYKMQVFAPHQHDHLRTRMTHTLEVAQIGRTIGRALRLNEDLIEAVALAHDLGHPPFGHDGESVLDEMMADSGGFEHNRQSLRVVDYLEHPYPQFRGLNLSQVVRECLAKHQTRYDRPGETEFDLSLQAPLEGQLVDLADEIAYTSADLDDALGAQRINAEQLSDLSLWRRAWQVAQDDCPNARPIHKEIRACKALLAAMADDVIRTTTENLGKLERLDQPRSASERGFSSTKQNDPARLLFAGGNGLDAVRRAGRRIVGMSAGLSAEVGQMHKFLMEQVYVHPLTEEQKLPCRQMIRDLFGTFMSKSNLLPARYAQRVETEGLNRVVCDYIAGMTDRYCRLEHERVVGK